MINKNKQYKTRDGREVRIYAVDGRLPDNIHGAAKCIGGWEGYLWNGNTGRWLDHKESIHDLIEAKPRIKRKVWVNVYAQEAWSDVVHQSKEQADSAAAPNRIACVKLTIDCEEGEGL